MNKNTQEIVLQSNLRESLHLHVARILYMVQCRWVNYHNTWARTMVLSYIHRIRQTCSSLMVVNIQVRLRAEQIEYCIAGKLCTTTSNIHYAREPENLMGN